ncbi:MAG TPA: hypothetical protein VN516_03330 [Candidatus Baltobacteraceae bacterium]|nr:hypothetical protein [Candidatus Baltobacteraceae bacterium]
MSRTRLVALLLVMGTLGIYLEAARLDPGDWHAPFLAGKTLLSQGRDVEAISYLQIAVNNNHNNPKTLLFVAQVLASDENLEARDGNLALDLAQRADTLTAGSQPAMLDAMAMAYAELGRFADAQNTAKAAVALASQFDMTNDVQQIQQRLELYNKRQPFRQSFASTTNNSANNSIR